MGVAFFYNHSCVLRQQNPELKIHDDDLGVLQLVPSFKGMGQKDMGPRALKEITRLTGRSGASAVIFLEHVLNHIEMGDDFSTIVERELEREKATCHKFHINNQKRPITTQKKNQKS